MTTIQMDPHELFQAASAIERERDEAVEASADGYGPEVFGYVELVGEAADFCSEVNATLKTLKMMLTHYAENLRASALGQSRCEVEVESVYRSTLSETGLQR